MEIDFCSVDPLLLFIYFYFFYLMKYIHTNVNPIRQNPICSVRVHRALGNKNLSATKNIYIHISIHISAWSNKI